mmetsp:Transcript_531/g.1563  ORF Transcript_531/g.1563 Transcript_531/m.1563 type:complete len:230 (+) Transcript_531:1511-2200(+)
MRICHSNPGLHWSAMPMSPLLAATPPLLRRWQPRYLQRPRLWSLSGHTLLAVRISVRFATPTQCGIARDHEAVSFEVHSARATFSQVALLVLHFRSRLIGRPSPLLLNPPPLRLRLRRHRPRRTNPPSRLPWLTALHQLDQLDHHHHPLPPPPPLPLPPTSPPPPLRRLRRLRPPQQHQQHLPHRTGLSPLCHSRWRGITPTRERSRARTMSVAVVHTSAVSVSRCWWQ